MSKELREIIADRECIKMKLNTTVFNAKNDKKKDEEFIDVLQNDLRASK